MPPSFTTCGKMARSPSQTAGGSAEGCEGLGMWGSQEKRGEVFPTSLCQKGGPLFFPQPGTRGSPALGTQGHPPPPPSCSRERTSRSPRSLRALRPRTSTHAPQAASYCAREAPDRGAGRCDSSRALHARFCRWPPPPAPPPASRASPQGPIGRDWNRRASSHSPRPMGVGGCGGARGPGRGSRCGLGRAKHLVP